MNVTQMGEKWENSNFLRRLNEKISIMKITYMSVVTYDRLYIESQEKRHRRRFMKS